MTVLQCFIPVSYTHLDVYKRQQMGRTGWVKRERERERERKSERENGIFFS